MEGKLDIFSRYIRNFEVSHYVWIYEKDERAIYESIHSKKKKGKVKNHNRKIARVIAFKQFEKEDYYYLEIEGKEIGWATLKTSNVIYSKPRVHVKINTERYNQTRADQLMPLDRKQVGQLKNQMLDSRFMMIRNGTQYEALFKGMQMIGWFSRDVLYQSQKANITVPDYSSNIKLYHFNNLTSKVKADSDKLKSIKIIHIFKELGLVKVRTDMGDYWTETKYLNFDSEAGAMEENDFTFEDIVVYDLIQNISEERKMTVELMEKIRNQYGMSGEGINARPGGLQGELDLLENELEEERSKREKIEEKYNNLRKSFLGRIQTKYWAKRSK
ncbi:hypothetical protein [Salinicoccus luteus]|uniref:hypothetical protein n=1 Tax=Salinicoccus luteus TaxID=367840 RepID=UPI0004E19D52|nr:hypothetical protein [Salinicoccus luteus]